MTEDRFRKPERYIPHLTWTTTSTDALVYVKGKEEPPKSPDKEKCSFCGIEYEVVGTNIKDLDDLVIIKAWTGQIDEPCPKRLEREREREREMRA